jgi:sugar phosphate isomerase/epimerase
MIDFGMPTLIELKSLNDCAALCKELGLRFIELNMNLPEYQADKLDMAALSRIAAEYGITYTIHLDENLNPSDFNEKVANAYTETVLQTIEIAKHLHIPVLTMHMASGVWFTLPDRKVFLFEEYEKEYMQKLIAFRNVCSEAIGGADIRICVENCGEYARFPFLRNGLELLLESPAFALTFDIGHNAAAGYSDEPTIMEHTDRLIHMHVHDASGRSNHLPLGKGDVDLAKYLALAKKKNCRAVLEVKTVAGLKESVEWIKEIGGSI